MYAAKVSVRIYFKSENLLVLKSFKNIFMDQRLRHHAGSSPNEVIDFVSIT
jgi:hypothetical protein